LERAKAVIDTQKHGREGDIGATIDTQGCRNHTGYWSCHWLKAAFAGSAVRWLAGPSPHREGRMAKRDVVVVGASAGGVEALRSLVAGLPAAFPAAVMIVLHLPRSSPSALPAILSRAGPLPARAAIDGEPLTPGRIYVAPVDRHLIIVDHRIRLSHGAAENGHRPAIDPLFRSAAYVFGPRAIGVVLSGSRDDGSAGLAAIASRGGITIVQDPDEAIHAAMPLAALEQVEANHVLPAAKIGGALAEILRDEAGAGPAEEDEHLAAEVAISELSSITTDQVFDAPAGYGCPACGGSLYALPSGPVPRFRCRVGHAWSPDSLLDEQSAALESGLWAALRALEERRALSRSLAESRAYDDLPLRRERYAAMAEEADRGAAAIRTMIDNIGVAGV
jgi:two-component system, chemotaxis family, protein-glutamate methylesterase/glutaminase